MNKLISVIIPVKDGEMYLEAALEGILMQNMNIEIIVVDDASADSTAKIAQRYGCRVLHHDICKGPVAGKNTGVAAARGEYIMFHDADDILREGALKLMYDALEADPSLSAAMAKVMDFISPDLTEDESVKYVIKEKPYYGVFSGATLIHKSVFDIIGMFDDSLYAGEVISWRLELDSQGMTIQKLDFVSADRRVHNSNYGRTRREKEFHDYAGILRNRMAQKRSAMKFDE